MLKKTLYILLSSSILCSCITVKPKDFSYLYDKQDTGLSSRIDINGYYTTQRGCDTSFGSAFMFYPDGLFTIATGSDLTELVESFGCDKQSTICSYPAWGIYKIVGDTIKTQTIIDESLPVSTIFRDYLILPNGNIENISDYVYPQNTQIGYMKNYPSFKQNECPQTAVFHKLNKKRNPAYCPYLKKRWFIHHIDK